MRRPDDGSSISARSGTWEDFGLEAFDVDDDEAFDVDAAP